MALATGASHSLRYKKEVTYGTDPGGNYTVLRHTGTTLGLSKDALESEELRADRQVAHYRHGTKNVSGDINFELSYGTYDELLEGVMCATFATDVDEDGSALSGTDTLEPGTSLQSFTFERYHADIDQAIKMTGCQISSMSLSIAPNSMVTGAFSILGKDLTISATQNASPVAANSNQPFDGFSGTITEGGSSIAIITALELNIDNGLEATYVVGSETTLQSPLGKSMVTGSITAYFQDATLINKFVNETASSLKFELVDQDSNKYIFEMPKIKYNSGNPEVGGPGQITTTLEFIALYEGDSPASGSQLSIKRVDA